MKTPLQRVIRKINITPVIAEHLVGENHKPKHHMSIGGIIIIIGTSLSLAGGAFEHFLAHVFFDAIGYAIHGIGLIPFIDTVINQVKQVE